MGSSPFCFRMNSEKEKTQCVTCLAHGYKIRLGRRWAGEETWLIGCRGAYSGRWQRRGADRNKRGRRIMQVAAKYFFKKMIFLCILS